MADGGKRPPEHPTKSPRVAAERVKTARGRTASSTHWLARQLNDPYVHRARREGYHSRAAFKLIELDDRFKLLRPGARVVDLGAAPGGWSQVAVARVKAPDKGKVVAIDLNATESLPGADRAGDGFPGARGARMRSRLRSAVRPISCCPTWRRRRRATPRPIMSASWRSPRPPMASPAPCSRRGGAFVAKVYQGGAEGELLAALKRDFASVRHAKPPASRAELAEVYVVAQEFRGAQ